jgi:hypothetical protein
MQLMEAYLTKQEWCSWNYYHLCLRLPRKQVGSDVSGGGKKFVENTWPLKWLKRYFITTWGWKQSHFTRSWPAGPLNSSTLALFYSIDNVSLPLLFLFPSNKAGFIFHFHWTTCNCTSLELCQQTRISEPTVQGVQRYWYWINLLSKNFDSNFLTS